MGYCNHTRKVSFFVWSTNFGTKPERGKKKATQTLLRWEKTRDISTWSEEMRANLEPIYGEPQGGAGQGTSVITFGSLSASNFCPTKQQEEREARPSTGELPESFKIVSVIERDLSLKCNLTGLPVVL